MALKTEPNARGSTPTRLWGIDSIRFLMALSVVVGHLPRIRALVAPHQYSNAYRLMDVTVGLFVNGPAAVIVFFLISGLCIHLPYRKKLGVGNLYSYFSRRLIRVCLPMGAALFLVAATGTKLTLMDTGYLWSLICEIVYYVIYPCLLRLRRSFTWQQMIMIAYCLAFALMLTNPTAQNYPSFTNLGNWIIGLPCWLLGCLVAEQSDMCRDVSAARIWLLRFAAFAVSTISIVLRWHLPAVYERTASIGSPWSLDAFALVAFVWLSRELQWQQTHRPIWPLESAGRWSYSLYLMHTVGFWLTSRALLSVPLRPMFVLLLDVAGALITGFVFFRLVEMPSHVLAISVSRRLKHLDRAT